MEPKTTTEPLAKRPRTDKEHVKKDFAKQIIPTFDLDSLSQMSSEEFLESYDLYQAMHFKGECEPRNEKKSGEQPEDLSWRNFLDLYESLGKSDQESWCIENPGTQKEQALTFKTFLAPKISNDCAYCSFLVQKDKDSYEKLLKRLPFDSLSPSIDMKWAYEPCVWIFFGRNPQGNAPLEGRGLHTDSVNHDGTWHYQLSGQKDWYLSPSCELMNHWKKESITEEWDESTKIHVPCREGDVIVVNTKLWFHRTVIPSQATPSVSYARDFRLVPPEKEAEDNAGMSNLDGLYARTDIEAGTIIFTEKDMPDCELHRSKDNPNCEVVELDDGISAVVSKRNIACGEFFCVAESSDEEDGEDDEEFYDEEEEEEEESR